jgi:transposase
VRFETGPGEQAQVDFGQLQVWIGEVATPVHFFVFTLGFSRRAVAYAYRNERLDTLLDGHERALRHFGGVPLTCLYDNPRTITLGRSAGQCAVASALRGLRTVLRLHAARVPAVSGADQG